MAIPHLTFDDLTPAEKLSYESGEWLAAHPVKSSDLQRLRRGPDWSEDAAAELAARVRIELEQA